jgi:hypothetical protein
LALPVRTILTGVDKPSELAYCYKCKADKPRSEFYYSGSKRQGITSECRECCKAIRSETGKRQGFKAKAKLRRQRIRAEVLAAYGTVCACCGEDKQEFLTIDHVNGDGAAERRRIGKEGSAFYKWLKQQGFPPGRYRTLCYNCNCSIGFYGYCPHGTLREEDTTDLAMEYEQEATNDVM